MTTKTNATKTEAINAWATYREALGELSGQYEIYAEAMDRGDYDEAIKIVTGFIV